MLVVAASKKVVGLAIVLCFSTGPLETHGRKKLPYNDMLPKGSMYIYLLHIWKHLLQFNFWDLQCFSTCRLWQLHPRDFSRQQTPLCISLPRYASKFLELTTNPSHVVEILLHPCHNLHPRYPFSPEIFSFFLLFHVPNISLPLPPSSIALSPLYQAFPF